MSSPAKRPDPATRREQLLDAADAIFSVHGVNAPLELIVAHAEVGRATLYRQFPDRHAILLALMERSAERMQSTALTLSDQPDAFFQLLDYMADRIVRSPALAEHWRITSLKDPRFDAPRQQIWDAFGPALHRAQAAGLVRTDLEVRDLYLLSGMLAAALRGNSEAERKRLNQQALAILKRGLQPEAPRNAT